MYNVSQTLLIQLDFEDPRQKMVNLGSLQVGQRSHQLISLINNSALAITFTLQFNSTVDALHDAQVGYTNTHTHTHTHTHIHTHTHAHTHTLSFSVSLWYQKEN